MRLITCSNSCPRWDTGRLAPASPGGLSPMLVHLLEQYGGSWIFTAPAGHLDGDPIRLWSGVELHPLPFDEATRQQHYDTISIELLLGMLHYLHDTSIRPFFDAELLAAWAGYESVNRAFAKRLQEVSADQADEFVLINDPHLMLVPEYLAAPGERAGDLVYFLGTPWCEPEYFCLLPGWLRTRLLVSLLRCDVVGFHAERWVSAFLACCARFLPEARITGRSVHYRGGTTRLVAVPFPVDVPVLEAMRDDPATARWAARLTELAGSRRLLCRADRLDLWKNLPRGFAAYEAMLERRPELADQAWLLAIATVPTRDTERHRGHQQLCESMVERINARFGSPGREAVTMLYPTDKRDSRNCVVAALTMAQAAMVNSTYDGLNLFAKEAALLLPDSSTLLLSANAGVYEQLADYVEPIDPFDIDQTSSAMESALSGQLSVRPELGRQRRAVLAGENSDRWLAALIGG